MKPQFLLYLILNLSALGSLGQSPAAKAYTFSEILEIALKHNVQVQQGQLEVQKASLNYKQAKANMLPELSATANQGLNQGRSIDPFSNSYVNQNIGYSNFALNGGLTLFNGLVQQNLIRKASMDYQASKMEQQQTKDNTTIAVLQTYFEILGNEEKLSQAVAKAQITQKQVDRLTLLNKQGAIAPSQLAEIRGQLADDELDVISSRNQLNAAKLSLEQLMGLAHDAEFQVERLALTRSPENGIDPKKIYLKALEQFAPVKASIFRRESAQKGLAIARGYRLPQLALSGNIYSNYSSAAQTSRLLSISEVATADYVNLNGSRLPVMTSERAFEKSRMAYRDQIRNNYSSSLSLALRIPLSNSLKYRNQVSLAKIDLSAAELAEENIKHQLKNAIELEFLNMTAAEGRIKVLTDQISAYKEAFQAAQTRFNLGLGTIIDYTIAKNNLDKASSNLISARYEYLFRCKLLSYYQGDLFNN